MGWLKNHEKEFRTVAQHAAVYGNKLVVPVLSAARGNPEAAMRAASSNMESDIRLADKLVDWTLVTEARVEKGFKDAQARGSGHVWTPYETKDGKTEYGPIPLSDSMAEISAGMPSNHKTEAPADLLSRNESSIPGNANNELSERGYMLSFPESTNDDTPKQAANQPGSKPEAKPEADRKPETERKPDVERKSEPVQKLEPARSNEGKVDWNRELNSKPEAKTEKPNASQDKGAEPKSEEGRKPGASKQKENKISGNNQSRVRPNESKVDWDREPDSKPTPKTEKTRVSQDKGEEPKSKTEKNAGPGQNSTSEQSTSSGQASEHGY